jgi:hypothetical protein
MPVLDELLVRIGMDTTGVEEGTQEVNQQMDGLAAPAAAAGLAAGGLFVAGLTNAMDASAANTKLQNQLALNDEEAERAGSIAGDVFSEGFSDSIAGVNEAMSGVIQAMGGMGKVSDKELSQMTKSAVMLGETFELDVGEAATAAGQLIANDLVADGEEAFDVLTRAAQTLPKSMVADIPAVVTEYGKHFSRLGLDAQTAFGMMSQYVQAGGRDIDQAADVIHEFARITSEETDRAAEGFKELGLNSKQMLTDIGKGGDPAEAALGKTLEKLRQIKDPAKQAELGIALFGDMAGEGADALWAMDPAAAAASSGMDKAGGAAKEATDKMAASKSLDSIWRTLTTTLGEYLAPALQKVNQFMTENPGVVRILVPLIIGLAIAFGIFAIAVWAVNIAMMANPIAWIILGIIALIAVVALIIIKWDEIKESTAQTWGYIGDKLGEFFGWVSKKASEFWDWLSKIFSDGWAWIVRNVWDPVRRFFTQTIPGWVDKGLGWIEDKWNGAISFFAGIPGRIASGARGMWNFVTDGLKSALNGAISLVNSGIFFINDKLIANANRLPGVSIPWIPYIPYLAEGGVTTGPTLAMIGEGSEQEAVLPLSKLEQMISVGGGAEMRAPSVSKVQQQRMTVGFEPGGGDAFIEWLMETIRIDFDGDVSRLGEEGR